MHHANTDLPPVSNTIDRASERIGLGRTTLYEYIRSGDLRTFKVGKRRLILETELQSFVAKLSGSVEATR